MNLSETGVFEIVYSNSSQTWVTSLTWVIPNLLNEISISGFVGSTICQVLISMFNLYFNIVCTHFRGMEVATFRVLFLMGRKDCIEKQHSYLSHINYTPNVVMHPLISLKTEALCVLSSHGNWRNCNVTSVRLQKHVRSRWVHLIPRLMMKFTSVRQYTKYSMTCS